VIMVGDPGREWRRSRSKPAHRPLARHASYEQRRETIVRLLDRGGSFNFSDALLGVSPSAREAALPDCWEPYRPTPQERSACWRVRDEEAA
jgi:hypothetical protein